jgi:anti-sigma regulatory factor (Ser/Thr protein kinase)
MLRTISTSFLSDPRCLQRVRGWVAARLKGTVHEELLSRVLVAVNELAANALIHTPSGQIGGSFTVTLAWDERALRAVIGDQGGDGFPELRIPDVDAESGRGLMMTADLADRWDWRTTVFGCEVACEFDRPLTLVCHVAFDYGGTLDDRSPGQIRDRCGSYPLHPAVPGIIDTLTSRDVRVLVASGTLPGQSRDLALAPVTDQLSAVLETDRLGHQKTSEVFWQRVIKTADADHPGQVLYVGDGIDDVVMALRHGMQTALVTGGRPAEQEVPRGVVVIGHVSELPALLFGRADR